MMIHPIAVELYNYIFSNEIFELHKHGHSFWYSITKKYILALCAACHCLDCNNRNFDNFFNTSSNVFTN
jgi:hypothetical protein